MKIGILTWYYAMNHGARAHTYALLRTLREMGYEAEIIAYQSWHSYIDVEPYWVISKHLPRLIRRIKYRLYFKQSEKGYGYLSKKVHTVKEINRLGYDLIILGSDEIFNINHLITSKDYIYFGVGIDENTPTITYAVSCGQSDANIIWPPVVVNSVKNIKALSVRDKNSQQIINNNTGMEPTLVLDPTLLYDFDGVSDNNWQNRSYVLIYTFGFVEAYKEQIVEYSRKNKLKIICVGNTYEWADINIQYPTQAQWYAAFKYADLVITNSFHGTIFAIKNHKRFVNIHLDDKVTKISNLLEQFGLRFDDRLMTKEKKLEMCIKKEVNYDEIDPIIDEYRVISLKWLRCEIDNNIKDKKDKNNPKIKKG